MLMKNTIMLLSHQSFTCNAQYFAGQRHDHEGTHVTLQQVHDYIVNVKSF